MLKCVVLCFAIKYFVHCHKRKQEKGSDQIGLVRHTSYYQLYGKLILAPRAGIDPAIISRTLKMKGLRFIKRIETIQDL